MSAAKSARSPFLRCESYRLLSVLHNPKLNPQSSELDNLALKKTSASAPEVAGSIIAGLKDDDMLKGKRVREILKACEKILEFATAFNLQLPNLTELEATAAVAATKADGKGVRSAVDKLTPLFAALRDTSTDADGTMEEDNAEKGDSTVDEGEGAQAKKDKKKKKKKKRGKK